MIVVCDVNTIWRHRPFAAMAKLTEVLSVAPFDWIWALKNRERTPGVLQVVLPPSWATRTAAFGQRMLWLRINQEARRRNQKIECVVVTSPHYLTLLDLLPEEVVTIYYASDDYRSYEGWDDMAQLEERLVRRVDHSFFISETLAERARTEYSVAPDRVSVSMNGTESRFFPSEGEVLPVEPPNADLPRPIAGVVGGINPRLDFELLHRCAELEEMGTLLLVGPIPDEPSKSLQKLLAHPKCISVGSQPHGEIHRWFKCLDVGLIPYVPSELNNFCSPMRLFDHLATGLPLVGTDACDQLHAFEEQVEVCGSQDQFVEAVHRLVKSDLSSKRADRRGDGISWDVRACAMHSVIGDLVASKSKVPEPVGLA